MSLQQFVLFQQSEKGFNNQHLQQECTPSRLPLRSQSPLHGCLQLNRLFQSHCLLHAERAADPADFFTLVTMPPPQPSQALPTVTVLHTTTVPSTTATPAAVGFFNNLLDKIPLPRWAIYTIFGGGALLIILCCLCICIKCCCRNRKKKKKKQQEQLKLKGANGKTSTALVQPDVGDVDYGAMKLQRGKLLYSLEYNATLSELTVGIKRAEGLKAMDLGGSSDPYVKIYLCPEKSKTCETKVFRNMLNPIFNEQFTFQISKASLLKSTAVMQVIDFNRFSKHNIIGEVRLQLSDIDWKNVIEEWRDLAKPAQFEVAV